MKPSLFPFKSNIHVLHIIVAKLFSGIVYMKFNYYPTKLMINRWVNIYWEERWVCLIILLHQICFYKVFINLNIPSFFCICYILREKTACVAQHVAYLLSVGKVMGLMFGPNCVIAKDVKSCTYCCWVRCTTCIIWVGGMPLP